VRVLGGKNTREALSAGLQWRRSDEFEVNVDFLYNAFDQVQVRGVVQPHERGLATDVYQPNGITFVQLGNGQTAVSSLNSANCVSTGGRPCIDGINNGATRGQTAQQFSRRSDTIGGGLNLVWRHDDGKVRGDYSYTKLYSLQRTYFAGVSEVPAVFQYGNVLGAATPTLSFQRPAADDSSQVAICCSFIAEGQNRSDKHTFQLDLERQVGAFTFKVGGVHNRTGIDFRSANRFFFYNSDPATGGGGTGPNGTAGLYDRIFTPEQITTFLRSGYAAGGVLTAFRGTPLAISFPFFDSVAGCNAVGPKYCNAITNVGTYSFNGTLPITGTGLDQLGDPLSIAGSTYFLQEYTTSGYGQVDYDGAVFSLPFKANLGLRVLHEEVKASGISGINYENNRSPIRFPGVNPTVRQFVVDQNKYTEFLPSLNTNLHISSNTALRFSVSRTASLPSYENLIPVGNVVIYEDKNFPGYLGIPDDANFGNTRLKPITSWNYDLTFEYYTRSGGAFIVSGFYKSIKNFIFTRSIRSTIPAVEQFPLAKGNVFNVVSPVNVSRGTVKVFEVSASQPFTFLPGVLNGFGVQANFTYVDSKFENPDKRPELSFGFPGASKYNGNAILYYEKGGAQIRAAYVYRSKYLTGTGIETFAGSVVRVNEGYGTLDLSGSYRIIPNVEVTGAISNLTGVQSKTLYQPLNLFQSISQRPRIFSLSLRGYF